MKLLVNARTNKMVNNANTMVIISNGGGELLEDNQYVDYRLKLYVF